MCNGLHILFIAIACIALVYFGFIGLAVIALVFIELWECLINYCMCNCVDLSRQQDSANVSDAKPIRKNTIVPSDIVMIRNPDGNLQLGKISMV